MSESQFGGGRLFYVRCAEVGSEKVSGLFRPFFEVGSGRETILSVFFGWHFGNESGIIYRCPKVSLGAEVILCSLRGGRFRKSVGLFRPFFEAGSGAEGYFMFVARGLVWAKRDAVSSLCCAPELGSHRKGRANGRFTGYNVGRVVRGSGAVGGAASISPPNNKIVVELLSFRF